MRNWDLRLWDGYQNRSMTFKATNYHHARFVAGVAGYPPGYIWSIEEIKL